MGLTVSHNCYQGSCSHFNDWREFIASKIGIPLRQMEGWSKKELPIRWASFIKNGLYPLLTHRDDAGILTPSEAEQIADGLRQILATMSQKDEWYRTTKQFMEGCVKAHEHKYDITFS